MYIILINNLYGYANHADNKNWQEYKKLIITISENSERLFLFKPRFQINSKNPLRNIIYDKIESNKIKLIGKEKFVDNFYDQISENYENIHLYNQTDFLVKLGGGFEKFTSLTKDKYPIYKDHTHITPHASKLTFSNFSNNFLNE